MPSGAVRYFFIFAAVTVAAPILVPVLHGGPSGQASEGQPATVKTSTRPVSALGRLEPEHGIIRVAAPSTPQSISGAVLKSLLVEEGDKVSEGQLLAITDTAAVMEATMEEVQAELELTRRQSEASHSHAEEACVRADVAAREAEKSFSASTRLRKGSDNSVSTVPG